MNLGFKVKTHTHPLDNKPARLDRIVATMLGVGLRASRTHIEQGQALVDGRRATKGTLVQPGQMVAVPEISADGPVVVLRSQIIRQNAHYAAIFKPSAMHTVFGKEQSCVQEELPRLGLAGWSLVNRLDYLTSGLVLAARTKEDVLHYKTLQDNAQVAKYYLAVVHGIVESNLLLQQRIADQRCKKVRILEEMDEPVRWTHVQPIQVIKETTLVAARIYKGRRHQIRAHLAHAGYPLAGDPVYGSGQTSDFFLSHCLLVMPDFKALYLPPMPDLATLAHQYLCKIIEG